MTTESVTSSLVKALTLLQNNNTRECLALLRSAFKGIQARAVQASSILSDDSSVDVEAVSLRAEENVKLSTHDSSKYFTFYDNGFQFAKGTCDNIFRCKDCLHRGTAMLLFNAGLAYHMKALGGKYQRASYERAILFYKVVLATLGNIKSKTAADHFIAVACINNQGHIYSTLGEFAAVQRCMMVLKSAVDACVQNGLPPNLLAGFHLTLAVCADHASQGASPAA